MTRNSLILAMVAALSMTSLAFGAIAGTAHDFSGETWSNGEICKPCHTPHNADVSMVEAPLWNHELTVASYTMYDGGAAATPGDALDVESILCMSCHDGTVALDSFGGAAGTTLMDPNDDHMLGTDISNDHPVGATSIYPLTSKFVTPDANRVSSHGHDVLKVGSLKLKVMTISAVEEDVVGCGSCHTPHGKGYDHLLRMDNAGSALCLNCHNK